MSFALLRMTYAEMAATRSVSINTIKSQMKILLAKFDVNKMSDLPMALGNLLGRSPSAQFHVCLEGYSKALRLP